ncbi:tripartite tricarboxylate transporter permease [Isoptericola croceus]|uniref:tripartite tricarboxylate transporter permease n=1 Tax=Isoptericola croceus TaxID=3031406 RepID=UPI0023F699B6|nr:tripartite tricarboxylate transporter permease [Isoptericola croceus]
MLQIPRHYLYAGIILFGALGSYALNFSPVDVLMLLAIGLVGFFMRRYGYPVATMVVGMILGPMAEERLRRSLAISQGDLTHLVTSPFAAFAYAAIIVIVGAGMWLQQHRERRVGAELEQLVEDVRTAAPTQEVSR